MIKIAIKPTKYTKSLKGRLFILKYENKNTYDFLLNFLNEKDIDIYNFSMIIGYDNAVKFNLWQNADKLKNIIPFIVIPRGNFTHDNLIDHWFLKKPHKYLSNTNMIICSSTQVKNELKQNLSSNLLDKKVQNYIIKNKLYKE